MTVRAELHDRRTLKGVGDNGDGSPWTGLLEVAQAFYRWQNTYSPAGTLEQEFFARPVPELCTVHQDFPATSITSSSRPSRRASRAGTSA